MTYRLAHVGPAEAARADDPHRVGSGDELRDADAGARPGQAAHDTADNCIPEDEPSTAPPTIHPRSGRVTVTPRPPCPTCGHVEIPIVRRRRPAPETDPPVPGVIDIDHQAYRQAWLKGDLGPGTYRIWDGIVRRRGARSRLVTVPARLTPWCRSPHGWLWHRIRHADVEWRGITGDAGPRLCVHTWCGPAFYSGGHRRPRPLEMATARPDGPVCSWCDTAVPDRRRLPDRLDALDARGRRSA